MLTVVEGLREVYALANGLLEAAALDDILALGLDALEVTMEPAAVAIVTEEPEAGVRFSASRRLSGRYRATAERAPVPEDPGGFALMFTDPDQLPVPIRAALIEEGIQSMCVVPFAQGQLPRRWIHLYFDVPRALNDTQLTLVGSIASHVALAIERKQAERVLREADLKYRNLVERVPAITYIDAVDEWSSTLYISPQVEPLLGYSPEEWLADPGLWVRVLHPEDRDEVLRESARTNATGVPFRLEYRLVGRGGDVVWVRDEAIMLRDEHGAPLFWQGVMTDVTERKNREAHLEFLTEAGAVLGASLDYERTLRRVARLAVPRLADACAIYILARDGSIERLTIQELDATRQAIAEEVQQRFPLDPSAEGGVAKVLRTGQAEFHPSASMELLTEDVKDPQGLRELIEPLGIQSFMCLPLAARGKTLGAITFVTHESKRRFVDRDLRLAQQLADRAALAIDNAKLFQDRDGIARILQQSLLPPPRPTIPGTEVAARFHPAGEGIDIGGDFYDVFPLGEQTSGVVIADVCGKGVEAARLTALARYTLRTAAMAEASPAGILGTLSEAFLDQLDPRWFCTAVFASVRRSATGATVVLCSGGHPLPLLLAAKGDVREVGVHGELLGVYREPNLVDSSIELALGDALILYTDGLVDRRSDDGTRYGEEHLIEVAHGAQGLDAESIASWIDEDVRGYGSAPLRDDIALLVIRLPVEAPD